MHGSNTGTYRTTVYMAVLDILYITSMGSVGFKYQNPAAIQTIEKYQEYFTVIHPVQTHRQYFTNLHPNRNIPTVFTVVYPNRNIATIFLYKDIK